MNVPTIPALQRAALDAIRSLATRPAFLSYKVAIVGNLAQESHMPGQAHVVPTCVELYLDTHERSLTSADLQWELSNTDPVRYVYTSLGECRLRTPSRVEIKILPAHTTALTSASFPLKFELVLDAAVSVGIAGANAGANVQLPYCTMQDLLVLLMARAAAIPRLPLGRLQRDAAYVKDLVRRTWQRPGQLRPKFQHIPLTGEHLRVFSESVESFYSVSDREWGVRFWCYIFGPRPY
ncbi:hypothetical protein BDW74DRAFT_177334 [Aspergillus multicolor]|uniref:uncharacterized protein n=1 Tax=Aspergillus multicolor TaxID=41759 RepID=UPI003CCE3534